MNEVKMVMKDPLFLTLILILCGWAQCQSSSQSSSNEDYYFTSPHCCPTANILVERGCLENVRKEKVNVKEGGMKYKITGLQCPNGMYLLDIDEEPAAANFDDDHNLYLGGHFVASKSSFCMAKYMKINQSTDLSKIDVSEQTTSKVALVCFEEKDDMNLPLPVAGILAFISVGFLLLTLLVYALVPQLRDLQGKCIICTSVSLAIAYLHLGLAQTLVINNMTGCHISGFLLYFWMLTAFFWMNVVSFNLMKSVVFRTSMISEKKTFLFYNIYAWGIPFLLLMAAIIAENVDGDHIKPGFGERSCWFNGHLETWSYFYGPLTTLIVLNIILFIITSTKLWTQTSYGNVTKLRSMRYKFLLYLKIFLVTGISWIFEILSFIHDKGHIVWLIMDTFNSLQGLILFLVLVLFRKRALKGLASRGFILPCAPNAHAGLDEECDEIIIEEEAPALTTLS